MDGRKAAFNVLLGVVIGASVPIVAAIVLTQALDGFRPLDHLFTLLFLCLACSVIGVLVNLPWSSATPSTRAFAAGEPMPPLEEFIFDAGDPPDPADAPRERLPQDSQESSRDRRPKPQAPSKRYAMSQREALRELGLEHHADDDAVREAFRKLVKEHHPDQANASGPEAVAEATRRFLRIREAYEVLIDEA
jgi:hypothetical protein